MQPRREVGWLSLEVPAVLGVMLAQGHEVVPGSVPLPGLPTSCRDDPGHGSSLPVVFFQPQPITSAPGSALG